MRRTAARVALLLVLQCGLALADAATDQAIRTLRQGEAGARVRAAGFLGEVREDGERDRVLAVLVRALPDSESAVRQAVARALGRRGDVRAVPALLARIDLERDPSVLASVLLALGGIGDAGQTEKLVEVATTYPVPSVRAAAVTALGDLGGERARRAALALVASPGVPDPDWSLRAAAVLALSRCGRSEDVGPVLEVFDATHAADHWFARSAIAQLVAALHEDPVPFLRRLAGDPDGRVAVTAAAGLASSGHPDALLALLRSPAPSIRSAAVTAIAQVRLERGYEKIRLRSRLDPDPTVRWACAVALFRLEDPLGDELVLLGLEAREPVVWAEAMALLADRTGENHGREPEGWRKAIERWRSRR
ncbi:MAG: HEAT repeat domain-containing protein [Planctomycetota bacterium]|jgi:HEAT repeat protein